MMTLRQLLKQMDTAPAAGEEGFGAVLEEYREGDMVFRAYRKGMIYAQIGGHFTAFSARVEPGWNYRDAEGELLLGRLDFLELDWALWAFLAASYRMEKVEIRKLLRREVPLSAQWMPELSTEPGAAWAAVGRQTEEELLEREDEEELKRRILDTVQVRQRGYVTARFFEGATRKEMAKLLGCTPEALRARDYRIRQHLRKKGLK